MCQFCEDVIAVFGEHYPREPNTDNTARLLSINESRGFPGMLGNIDCMHWQWKNCSFCWQGQFKGHKEGCTVILEAVAIFGFGTPSLAWQDQTMISMCCTALRYFLGLPNALLLTFPMSSMVTLIIKVIV
jgi:hypothetical protein